ncbi:MAG: hypothetical protein JF616_21015 [Fibrobacteres bacterium]|nr:hypothetical protein [Fibrobacterota bacterium]
MKIDFKILTTLVGCLQGLTQGMIFDPFDHCLKSAQVDSILVLGWEASPGMEPTSPPYRSFYTAAYQPGTCMLAKETWLDFEMKGPNIGTYTLRPRTRTVDVVAVSADGSQMTGTNYYTAEGKIDSTEYYETVEDETGKSVIQTTRSRSLAKPGYDLVQVLVRKGTRPWTLVQQDSIVPNGMGKIIFSKGETNAVTTCVSDWKTYACTPVGTSSSEELHKQVWYLTGDRVDSLRWFSLEGVHFETNIWFWSARSNTRAIRKSNVSSPRMAKPGTAYDMAGRRLTASNRAHPRFLKAAARKN